MCDRILWLLGIALDVIYPMLTCPPPQQRALAEVVQNTARMGIAGSKEIRQLGWLAGKVGTCALFCVTPGVLADYITYLYRACVCLHSYKATFQRKYRSLKFEISINISILGIWYGGCLHKKTTTTTNNSNSTGSSTLPACIKPSAMGGSWGVMPIHEVSCAHPGLKEIC